MDYRHWLPDDSDRTLAAGVRRRAVRVFTRLTRTPLRPLGEAGLRALFDSMAPRWDAIRANPVYRAALEHGLDQLSLRLPGAIVPPRTVLDVACGTGAATLSLVTRYSMARVVGIDISPRMIDRARQAVPQASFVVGSASQLPFGEGEFDLVVSLDGVFEAAELARVCSPGGSVVIVYSRGADIPVARPLDELANELAAVGMQCVADTSSAWWLWARRPR